MKRNRSILLAFILLMVGVAFAAQSWVRSRSEAQGVRKDQVRTKTLAIKWQRLVGDTGQTCDRCGSTQDEVRRAHSLLRKSLSPLRINVVLEEKTLTKAEAANNIEESNRIWVAGKPLETWLVAKSGTSDCASCESLCGGNVECRTVIADGCIHESVPSALIVKAGLIAAAEMIGAETAQARTGAAPYSGIQTITDGRKRGGDGH